MVAIRGSNNKENFVADFKAFQHALEDYRKYCADCEVEIGFYNVWNSLHPGVLDELADLGCGPGLETNVIHVTGHSLGASVATLAAAHFYALGFDVRSGYFFESPRLGNAAFKTWFDQTFKDKKMFRTSHQRDPVPDVPQAYLRYAHVGREVFFANSDKDSYNVCEDDYECEFYKPTLRVNTNDHCHNPVVKGGDFCFCNGWAQ